MTKKILVIGVDQSIPYLIQSFMKDDIIPNISKLYRGGVYCEGLSCPPCDTPTNWTTIATGATTAVHGTTSFYLHVPGEPFEAAMETRSRGSLSKYCTAEYIWDTAEKNGITPFVFNYPAGWPSNFKNGAMALYTWPLPDSLPRMLSFPSTILFSKDAVDNQRIIIETTTEKGLPQSNRKILKITHNILSKEIKDTKQIHVYILSLEDETYDSIALPKENSEEWIIVKKGEWSEWISTTVSSIYGDLISLFKIKLVALSEEGDQIKIQLSSLYNTQGWTVPESIANDIIKKAMILKSIQDQDVDYIISGKVKSYLLHARREAITIARTIKLMKDMINWKLCFFHIHLLDSVNHRTLAYLFKKSPFYNEKDTAEAWNYVKTSYMILDELVGNLLKTCVDENTIVIFLSDHGAIPSWRVANIPSALVRANLLNYKWNSTRKKFLINWKKTSIFPYLEPPYIWVNLKGRDPQGIVEPEDYDILREQVIKILYQMKDPDTGEKIVKLALKREEAAFLGQDGERVGDVVYYLHPKYTLFDGNLAQLNLAEQSPELLTAPEAYNCKLNFGAHAYYLPAQNHGNYSIKVPFIMNGPGINKGIELKNTINLIDVAPTIAHLLQIPRPKTSQGRIIHEALEI